MEYNLNSIPLKYWPTGVVEGITNRLDFPVLDELRSFGPCTINILFVGLQFVKEKFAFYCSCRWSGALFVKCLNFILSKPKYFAMPVFAMLFGFTSNS